MNFVILSNCQAIPLAGIINALRPLDETRAFEVHLLIEDEAKRKAAREAVDAADIIFYAPTSDAFPVEFVRASYIKKLTVDKICLPTFFFRGLQPDYIYLGESNQRFVSAIGDYHSQIILECFLSGRSVEETVRYFTSEDEYDKREYFKYFEVSLEETRRRDQACDVNGAEIILQNYLNSSSFFTINHPTNRLLYDVSKLALNKMELKYFAINPEYLTQDLGNGPITPVMPCMARRLNLRYDGCPLVRPSGRNSNFLRPEEFVMRTFKIYDEKKSDIVRTRQVQAILNKNS